MALVQEIKNGQLLESATSLSKGKEKSGGDLGKEDFLKLLVAQMQYQDPLEPESNTDYVAQLATFTQVEASENMVSTMEQMEANDLVGQTVIMKPTSSTTGETSYVSGVVDYVLREGSKVYLSINDSLYNLDDLDTVANGEYMEAVTMSNTFASLVADLPTDRNISLGDEAQISAIRTVYDGFTDYTKSFISKENLDKLTMAENKLNALKALQQAIAVDSLTEGNEKDEEEKIEELLEEATETL